jgi:dTDP-4-amino-4,6-dideoxygalactose transaminase
VVTGDAELARRCASLRHYGQSARYVHDVLGLNSRLDELHAAVLERAFLPRLERWTERRRQLARRYLAGLRHPGVRPLAPAPTSDPVWHLFPVFVAPEARPRLQRFLEERGVQTAIHYPRLTCEQAALAGVPHELPVPLSEASRLAASELSLPIHPYLEDAEADTIVEAVNAWPG